MVGNVGDLAIVLTESGKATEALQLLDPVVKAQTVQTGLAYSRLMEAQLIAFIGTNQVPQAIATMKTLEQQGGGGANLTQLYLKLGKLLQRELDALKEKGNTTAFAQMHQSYKTFLTTLAGAKTGQTYESLEWAGESLLSLDAYKEADEVLRRVLKEFTKDPQFLQQPGGRMSLLRTRLKMAAALRGRAQARRGELARRGAARAVSPVPRAAVREGDAPRGRGRVEARGLVGRAAALAGTGPQARGRPAPPARVLRHLVPRRLGVLPSRRKRSRPARRSRRVMRLTPHVGSPEMKAKYEALLKRLGKK